MEEGDFVYVPCAFHEFVSFCGCSWVLQFRVKVKHHECSLKTVTEEAPELLMEEVSRTVVSF